MDEKFTLFAEYVKHFKEKFDYIKDVLPDDVQEAYNTMIQVGDIFADPSNSDQSLREAVFGKVPREKIKWAVEVINNWQTKDERKAEAREEGFSRRVQNNQVPGLQTAAGNFTDQVRGSSQDDGDRLGCPVLQDKYHPLPISNADRSVRYQEYVV